MRLCLWQSALVEKDRLLGMQLPKAISSMFHSPQCPIPFGAAAGWANSFAFSCSLLLTQAHIEFPSPVCPVALPHNPLDEFMPIWEYALLFIKAQYYSYQQPYQHSPTTKSGRRQAGPDIIYVGQWQNSLKLSQFWYSFYR